MDLINVNPKDIIFALDIGTRTVIGTVGIVKDKKFHIVAESCIEHEERAMLDGQIHDINLVASAVQRVKSELEECLGFSLKKVAIAAAGRFLKTATVKGTMEVDPYVEIDKDIIRSIELTAVKLAEEKVNKQSSGKLYCVGFSVKSYFLNGYVISNLLSHKGENIAAEVIATFLPRTVVDSLYAVLNKVNLEVINLTLEPIAAMEAVIPSNLRLLNLALVDIGAGTSDIAISSKDTVSAYGMVPMAGDEVTELIAQNYLVDFNTAERIKRECSVKEKVSFIDVIGLENEIDGNEILEFIQPIVNKIGKEIAKNVIELNGGKSPNAIFLVGGGAHTPGIKEVLAKELNIPLQRIALKGREAVVECECINKELGSTGVTVLGIALVSVKRLGHDFIDVTLNDKIVSLFNSHTHTVMDVMLQAGINPKTLIGKNGKNIKFTLNGTKRVAFGTLGTNAAIEINKRSGSIDAEVREGDCIIISYAKNGKNASPKVMDYIQNLHSISFFVNDIITNLEPIVNINNNRANIETAILEGDAVTIIYPSTLKEYFEFFREENKNVKFYVGNEEIQQSYVINEGDRIYLVEEFIEHNNEIACQKLEVHNEENKEDKKTCEIEFEVIVNNKSIVLKKKENYVFIDIFEYIDFDLSYPKGNLVLMLNGNKAGYYDNLSKGDIINIYWE